MTKRTERAPAAVFELDAQILRQSMLRRLPKRVFGSSRLRLPAVPALLDHYVEMFRKLFALYGRAFTADELDHLRGLLGPELATGFSASRSSHVLVEYRTDEPPKATISYTFTGEIPSAEAEYKSALEVHSQTRIGNHPDCKVIELARSLGEPVDVSVLDIAARTGRNALSLARAGFPVAAAEAKPELCQIIRESAARAGLGVRLFEGDALATTLDLPRAHYGLVVASELACDFRDVTPLNHLFERASELVRPRGLLLLNAFLPVGGYVPDQLARELSFVFWSTIFLREELRAAAAKGGFGLVSEESVFEYEKERLPASAWPPTAWFEEWTRGVDAFDLPLSRAPVELRWLTFRKIA
jgi:hypothetical protein